MKKVLFIGFIMLLLFNGFLFTDAVDAAESTADNEAEVVDSNTAVEGDDQAKEDTLIIKTGHLSSTDGRIEGTKGMALIKGDVEINAEQLIYYEDKKRAEIEGDVVLLHDKGEISSETMEAWINDDRYIFKDNVSMLQNLDDGEFSLESPYLELMKEDNSFTANQGVVIEYNGRILKGEEVLYNDQDQTLELITNVQIEEENGDWVRSERALFYLETEEFTAEGSVELELDITSN